MIEALLVAWREWDRVATFHPRDHRRFDPSAGAMEDACQAVAEARGWKTSQLRGALAAWRRAGYTREQAVAAVLG